MAFELVPFSQIKSLLDLNQATIGDYPGLSVINDGMLSAFEDYTRRKFELVERTEDIFVGSYSTQQIPLKGIPISTVSSVVLTSTLYGDSELSSDDYEITDYGIRLLDAVSRTKVQVTYTGGLSASTDILKRAAMYQLAYEFKGKDQPGAETISTDGGTITRPELGLLKITKTILGNMMHPYSPV